MISTGPGAEEEFKLALELSPGGADTYDHYGWLCGALQRWDEALALVQRAQELDPLVHRADVATTLLRAGRYPEALEAALRTVEFEPDFGRGRSTLGWAYLKNGLVDQGLTQLERAVGLVPENTLYLAQLGQAYGELRPDREGPGSSATTRADVSGEIRLPLPHGVCLHRPG